MGGRRGVTRLLHQGVNCHYLISSFSEKTTHHAERGGSDRSRGGVEMVEEEMSHGCWVFHLEDTSGHMLEQICHLWFLYLAQTVHTCICYMGKASFLRLKDVLKLDLLAYDVTKLHHHLYTVCVVFFNALRLILNLCMQSPYIFHFVSFFCMYYWKYMCCKT